MKLSLIDDSNEEIESRLTFGYRLLGEAFHLAEQSGAVNRELAQISGRMHLLLARMNRLERSIVCRCNFCKRRLDFYAHDID